MQTNKMQFISTRTHGILDFLTAGFALAFPRVLNCSARFTNAVTMLALGKLGYGLLTRHELGVAKVIPMKTHLVLDAVGGATLAALPFLLEEENEAATSAAMAMGIFDIAAGPFTQTRASFESAPDGGQQEPAPATAAEPATKRGGTARGREFIEAGRDV